MNSQGCSWRPACPADSRDDDILLDYQGPVRLSSASRRGTIWFACQIRLLRWGSGSWRFWSRSRCEAVLAMSSNSGCSGTSLAHTGCAIAMVRHFWTMTAALPHVGFGVMYTFATVLCGIALAVVYPTWQDLSGRHAQNRQARTRKHLIGFLSLLRSRQVRLHWGDSVYDTGIMVDSHDRCGDHGANRIARPLGRKP
jgi:hypothetical protein